MSPVRPVHNDTWLTVKKGDIEKETIVFPDASKTTPKSSPSLESKTGYDSLLDAGKRRSVDEDEQIGSKQEGIVILDKAQSKALRQKASKQANNTPQKKAIKVPKKAASGGEQWFAQLSRSLFGKEIALMDVPLKVFYAVLAFVFLIVLYFVVFIL